MVIAGAKTRFITLELTHGCKEAQAHPNPLAKEHAHLSAFLQMNVSIIYSLLHMNTLPTKPQKSAGES